MPDSINHSLSFLENEGNFVENQLLDGSIGLSSLRRRRTICPSVSARALARVSPDFAFFRHFPGFFRVWLLLKPLSRSRSVAGVHVCVRVWLCIVYVVRCCACGKTLKTRGNREKCVWYGVCVVWCCEVRKYTKTLETLGKFTKHGLIFGTIWPSVDPKKVQNWPFSPTHCFYVSPGICRRFWPEVLTQTPKNAVFRPRSYSKGPNHALEKVLTKETPGIYLVRSRCGLLFSNARAKP